MASVDDNTSDRAEQALLELMGRTSVLAAAAADHDLTWLLELYSDTRTAPLEEGLVEAALLLRAAIPPHAARKDADLRERWTRQVDLTSALAARLDEETDEQAMVEAAIRQVHLATGAEAAAVFRLEADGRIVLAAGPGRSPPPRCRATASRSSAGSSAAACARSESCALPTCGASPTTRPRRRRDTSAPSSTCR